MYIGAIIGALNTILLYPKILPKEEYGLITTMTSMAILIAGLSSFGSTSSIVKYLPYFRDKDTKSNKGLISYLLIICLSISLIVTICLIIFKNWIQQPYVDSAKLLVDFYYYIIPLFLIQLFLDLFNNWSLAIFKTSFQMFQKEIYLRIGQTLLIFIYFLGFIEIEGFVLLYILMYLSSFLMMIFYLYQLGEVKIEKPKQIEKSKRKEILQFGGFTFFSSIASSLAFRIDALMIGALVVSETIQNKGLEATAVYFVALNIASVIELPFRAINQIVMPTIAHAFKEKEFKKINDVYIQSTETMLIIGGFVFLGIWSCIDQVINILPNEYENVKYIFLWLGIGKLINVATGTNAQILIHSHLYKYFTYLTVFGLLITIGLNYIFILKMETEGAALATAITYFIINFIIWGILLVKFSFQPFTSNNLKVIIIGILVYLLIFKLNINNDIFAIFVKASIITLVYWILIIKFKLSLVINDSLQKLLDKYGVKIKL